MATSEQYRNAYEQGYDAGKVYPWPREWRTLYGRHPLRNPNWKLPTAEAAGWVRGFRHACMDRVN